MSELTLDQIERLIVGNSEGDGWYAYDWDSSRETVIPGLGRVTTAQQFGGEGQGDQAWIVVKVVMENPLGGVVRYFRKDGWHASHDGTYYDGDFREVQPFERTVTVYE